MKLHVDLRSASLLLIVATALLANCHAAEPRKPLLGNGVNLTSPNVNNRLEFRPVREADPDAAKCVDMTYPVAPDLLKAALIKATSGNTITDKLLRAAPGSSFRLPAKLSVTWSPDWVEKKHHPLFDEWGGDSSSSSSNDDHHYHHENNKDSHQGHDAATYEPQETPGHTTKPYYPANPDYSSTINPDDVDPGTGLVFQRRGFVLIADSTIGEGTTTPTDQSVAGYGVLYAAGAADGAPTPFGVLATRTLVLKPVHGQTFLTINAEKPAGAQYPVPTSYTMFGALTDDWSLEALNDILSGKSSNPFGELLAGIVENRLPLSIYAAAGHVPETARVGLNPKRCLLELPCGGLVRGKAKITVAGTDQQALKNSIFASHLNDNDWIPQGCVKVQCDLQLTEGEKIWIGNGC